MNQAPVAVGIAGYGYWGPNLARHFDTLVGARLAAISEPDPARRAHAARLHPRAGLFEDASRMLAAGGIDALVVATPAASHHRIARAGLESGCHVLVEKPMADRVAECDDLIEAAESRGLTLMVGHTYLYSVAVRRVLEIIAGGEIGPIRYINCQRLNLGLFQKDINVARDLAPHDLSIILRVMGCLPETVNCQGNAHVHPQVEDVTNISLHFPGGRFATIQSSWLEPRKVRLMTFVGTRGMIVYDDLEPHAKIRVHDVRVDCPPHYDNFAAFQYSYHYGECRIPHLEQREPLAVMCAHFIDLIRDGGEPVSSGRDGREVVRVLEACGDSLRRRGAPVDVSQPAIASP